MADRITPRRFLRGPTQDEIQELAHAEHLSLTQREAEDWSVALDGLLAAVETLESYGDYVPEGARRYAISRVPAPAEDKCNAFIRKCVIEGSREGPLTGRTFAVKDNISVAGLPVTNGSRSLSYTAAFDAAVVDRLLAAGATLVGKLNMDDLSAGVTGETSYFGPPRNPVNGAFSAGGSSGGSGAAVGAGDCDFTLGVDQGGSGRIPASFCGVVAMKTTHGVVPSDGVNHLDLTLDSVTPIARSVEDLWPVMRVLCDLDEPQIPPLRGPRAPADDARRSQNAGALAGVRVGLVSEATREDQCTPAVLDNLEHTMEIARANGAEVSKISIPVWDRAETILGVLMVHLAGRMLKSEMSGHGPTEFVDVDRVHSFALSRRVEADAFPPLVKFWLLGERLLHEKHLNLSYARAHNWRMLYSQVVSETLEDYDVLVMPTTPRTAPRLAVDTVDGPALIGRGAGIGSNVCPLNLTGHPALALPNGKDGDGMPTSVQLVGRRFADAVVLDVGLGLERALAAAV